MRITRIKTDSRSPHCRVVEVDGARFATVPAEVVARLGLVKGLELDDGRRAKLAYAADVEGAYRVSVRMLGARPRAVNELLWKLRERGHNPSAAAEAVGRLEDQGLLDDARFAEHFVRVRSDKGHGPGRLIADLLARGVDRRVAERAVDGVLDSEGVDQLAQARALARKRAHQLRDQPRTAKRRRVLAYLRRRGFAGYEVTEIVDEVLSGTR